MARIQPPDRRVVRLDDAAMAGMFSWCEGAERQGYIERAISMLRTLPSSASLTVHGVPDWMMDGYDLYRFENMWGKSGLMLWQRLSVQSTPAQEYLHCSAITFQYQEVDALAIFEAFPFGKTSPANLTLSSKQRMYLEDGLQRQLPDVLEHWKYSHQLYLENESECWRERVTALERQLRELRRTIHRGRNCEHIAQIRADLLLAEEREHQAALALIASDISNIKYSATVPSIVEWYVAEPTEDA